MAQSFKIEPKRSTFVHKQAWMDQCDEQLQSAKHYYYRAELAAKQTEHDLRDMGDTWRDLKARVEALEAQIKGLTQTP